MIIYIGIGIKYIFVRNYNFTYMIMDNLTMSWFWYPNQWGSFIGILIPTNGNHSLVFWYPDQWELFIGILIPKPMGVIHWYSDTQPMGVIHWYFDTQTNGGYSLVFIGILIPRPMGVIHWYSDTQTNGGYSLVLWCPVTGI